MELSAALYSQRARASIQGQWIFIGVDYILGRSPFVITERIPRSMDLLMAPHRDLGRSLRHKPGWSSGVWMRSSEVFQGRRDCG
jgi:hypothetical protein